MLKALCDRLQDGGVSLFAAFRQFDINHDQHLNLSEMTKGLALTPYPRMCTRSARFVYALVVLMVCWRLR